MFRRININRDLSCYALAVVFYPNVLFSGNKTFLVGVSAENKYGSSAVNFLEWIVFVIFYNFIVI